MDDSLLTLASVLFQLKLQVRALIPSGIRSVVKHANFLSRDGCQKPSPSFNDYAFDLLNDQSLVQAEFNPCDHIPQLQVALNYATNVSEQISSFADLVVLDPGSPLHSQLEALFGNRTNFTGDFLLDNFRELSVR
jgi:hypothetical protein